MQRIADWNKQETTKLCQIVSSFAPLPPHDQQNLGGEQGTKHYKHHLCMHAVMT